MTQKGLFGGAIVAELPETLLDASEIRQIPDNQEVFLYPDSNVSVIIEILERVSQKSDMEAVKFHFEALAHDNDAVSSTTGTPFVLHNDRGDRTPSPILLRGSQQIPKFNTVTPDDVDILIALFRVDSRGKTADIVVSMNIPKSSEEGVGDERASAVEAEFNTLVSSLHILDYNLFD